MTESNSETPVKESWASRNRRHLIAFCMVILMLAFLVPSQLTSLTQDTNPVIGKMDGEPIRRLDLRDAAYRWNLLKRIMIEGQRGRVPLVNAIFGDKLVLTLDQHPEAYMLLLKEAHEDGPGGSDAVVERLIEMGYQSPAGRSDIEVQLEDDRVVGFENLRDDYALRFRTVLADLFAIFNRYAVFESSVKPSAPLIDRRLAAEAQTIQADLMEFHSRDYIDKVSPPTDEQLQRHFNLYAASQPGAITTENEFGFGYKVPDRVKLQAIRIPTAAVRELARNSKGSDLDRDDPTLPYKWVVEAQKFYIENPLVFIPQAEGSTTQPATAPTDKPRPFAEVRKELVEHLINQQTVRMLQQIEQRIRTRMEGDYQIWKTSRDMNMPTTQTSFGVAFESVAYLDAIADDIESHFKVRPTTANYADQFYDASELTALAGIGQSAIAMTDIRGHQQGMLFGAYAIQFFEPMIEGPELEDWSQYWLEPFELSEVCQQMGGSEDQYLFRVIAHEKSHVAREMGEARPRVEADWRRAEALNLAHADAQATLKSVAQSNQFVGPTTRPALSDVDISFKDGPPPALELEGNAAQQFVDKASSALLTVDLPGNLTTFTVPQADRAFLARRESVESDWTSKTEYDQARARVGGDLMSVLLTPDYREPDLAAERRRREYFDLQNIYERNSFVPEGDETEPATSQLAQ